MSNEYRRPPNSAAKRTHFGYQEVAESEKARRVARVFDSVADRYDLMNDLMSAGLHRVWKHFAVERSALRRGQRALDIAGGTADLAKLLARRVGPTGQVILTDINSPMLSRGRDRLLDAGLIIPAVQCDAERLPFANNYFDCVAVAFGLRNMTRKDAALAEMQRVLRPGGRVLILEFSTVWKPLQPLYHVYSFKVLPALGKLIANDAGSYRYLAESIRVHPSQRELQTLMEQAGLERVEFYNLSAGIVALHVGHKF